ncbi:kinesin-like protein 2, partial [Hyalella azteca]|uniref:Kinesin-like protein 2 n=1 Tax=Hyalella azteca TaxID=294128 RepID=A0A8B7NX53_HYAAZ
MCAVHCVILLAQAQRRAQSCRNSSTATAAVQQLQQALQQYELRVKAINYFNSIIEATKTPVEEVAKVSARVQELRSELEELHTIVRTGEQRQQQLQHLARNRVRKAHTDPHAAGDDADGETVLVELPPSPAADIANFRALGGYDSRTDGNKSRDENLAVSRAAEDVGFANGPSSDVNDNCNSASAVNHLHTNIDTGDRIGVRSPTHTNSGVMTGNVNTSDQNKASTPLVSDLKASGGMNGHGVFGTRGPNTSSAEKPATPVASHPTAVARRTGKSSTKAVVSLQGLSQPHKRRLVTSSSEQVTSSQEGGSEVATARQAAVLRQEVAALRDARNALIAYRQRLSKKIQKGVRESRRWEAERRFMEVDEAVEAVDSSIEQKNELICGSATLLHATSSTLLLQGKLLDRLLNLSLDEIRALMVKYFSRVIDIRIEFRKQEIAYTELELQFEDQSRLLQKLEWSYEQASLDMERRCAVQQRHFLHYLHKLFRHIDAQETAMQLARETALPFTLDADSDKFRASESDVRQLEMNLYYYKQQCQQLKTLVRQQQGLGYDFQPLFQQQLLQQQQQLQLRQPCDDSKKEKTDTGRSCGERRTDSETRVCPFVDGEICNGKNNGHSSAVEAAPAASQIILGQDHFCDFDAVFGADVSQKELYAACLEDLVQHFWQGYNVSVVGYGSCRSGKTYTITGPGFLWAMNEEEFGLLPRAVRQLYTHIAEHRDAGGGMPEVRVSVSYLMLCGGAVYDLLMGQSHLTPLPVLSDHKGSVMVPGLSSVDCSNITEVLNCLEAGLLARNNHLSPGASTVQSAAGGSIINDVLVNDNLSVKHVAVESRRHKHDCGGASTHRDSHASFTITLQQRKVANDGRPFIVCSRLNFVDLGGIEEIKSSSTTLNEEPSMTSSLMPGSSNNGYYIHPPQSVTLHSRDPSAVGSTDSNLYSNTEVLGGVTALMKSADSRQIFEAEESHGSSAEVMNNMDDSKENICVMSQSQKEDYLLAKENPIIRSHSDAEFFKRRFSGEFNSFSNANEALNDDEDVASLSADGKDYSLMTADHQCLADVIKSLVNRNHVGPVPYARSMLTQLLKESLGGNCLTLLVCCASPRQEDLPATLVAMKYGGLARYIINRPRVNDITSEVAALLADAQCSCILKLDVFSEMMTSPDASSEEEEGAVNVGAVSIEKMDTERSLSDNEANVVPAPSDAALHNYSPGESNVMHEVHPTASTYQDLHEDLLDGSSAEEDQDLQSEDSDMDMDSCESDSSSSDEGEDVVAAVNATPSRRRNASCEAAGIAATAQQLWLADHSTAPLALHAKEANKRRQRELRETIKEKECQLRSMQRGAAEKEELLRQNREKLVGLQRLIDRDTILLAQAQRRAQ